MECAFDHIDDAYVECATRVLCKEKDENNVVPPEKGIKLCSTKAYEFLNGPGGKALKVIVSILWCARWRLQVLHSIVRAGWAWWGD